MEKTIRVRVTRGVVFLDVLAVLGPSYGWTCRCLAHDPPVLGPQNARKIKGGYGFLSVTPWMCWSGRPDSNRRRPAWEALRKVSSGISAHHYQRLTTQP